MYNTYYAVPTKFNTYLPDVLAGQFSKHYKPWKKTPSAVSTAYTNTKHPFSMSRKVIPWRVTAFPPNERCDLMTFPAKYKISIQHEHSPPMPFAPQAQKGIDAGKKSTRFWEQCIVGWNYTWAPKSTKSWKWFCVRACAQFTKTASCSFGEHVQVSRRLCSFTKLYATACCMKSRGVIKIPLVGAQHLSFFITCLVLHSFQLQF